jgi:Zn finger protein HypA/HybF involved in hydrogenase expression
MFVLKCTDCGNTFKKEGADGDLIHCPVCEADYTLSLKDGKAKLEDFVYDDHDSGEL